MPEFKASARALDLLGRQQIANVPSAVNELFKNAYDAYATKVEADLIRPDNLLVIRDNGIGMTKVDFESKWLVLGTDSKFNASPTATYRPPHMALRPIAGEKGIGRLAIGMLGPQTLVLTRARRSDKVHQPLAAFVNWSAFAIPDIELSAIKIPVTDLKPGEAPNAKFVQRLVAEFRSGLVNACKDRRTQGLEALVYEELDTFEVDPELWFSSLGGLDFSGNSCGTHFFVKGVSSIVWDSVEPEPGKKISELVRHVVGFTDLMTRPPEIAPISLALRVHTGPGSYEDLIEESQFWSASDFSKADHEVHGTFDEFGHFDGDIRIFDNEPLNHKIANRDSKGHKTECGPFGFHLGYVQGVMSESRLNPIDFAEMGARLLEIAGVYVYRDGLRVLPYGDQENDWLRIEERRNKGASYYFFSYRRMFGCVTISRSKNPDLRDKAGREGFQQTRAYFQLRTLINGVLTQLAGDFFRDKDKTTLYQKGRKSNEKRQRAWDRHNASKNERLTSFRARMRKAEELLDDGVLQGNVDLELSLLEAEVRSITKLSDPDAVVRGLLDAESKYSGRLRGFGNRLDVSRPRGVALSTNLSRSYSALNAKKERLIVEVVEPAQRRLEEIVLEAAQGTDTNLDERLRVTTLLERQVDDAMKRAKTDAGLAKGGGQDLASRISEISNTMLLQMDQRMQVVLVEVNSFDFSAADRDGISLFLSRCRNEVALANEFFSSGLVALAELAEGLVIEWDDQSGLFSSLDITESVDSELEELTETSSEDLELAQIGLSVDIINHEFLSSVNAVRKGLLSLESWTRHNADLKSVYGILQTNFNHLENFLQLFSPLRKRFNAEKTEITGLLIRDYLRSVFFERLSTSRVNLEFSDRFLSRQVLSYASVILPSFVNLVDNALFWVSDRPEPRIISLDVEGSDWLISDNGPGIPSQYQDAVFKAGYTTKPGGRGLGLFIAREVLRRNGFDMAIDPISSLGSGTTFRIHKKKNQLERANEDS